MSGTLYKIIGFSQNSTAQQPAEPEKAEWQSKITKYVGIHYQTINPRGRGNVRQLVRRMFGTLPPFDFSALDVEYSETARGDLFRMFSEFVDLRDQILKAAQTSVNGLSMHAVARQHLRLFNKSVHISGNTVQYFMEEAASASFPEWIRKEFEIAFSDQLKAHPDRVELLVRQMETALFMVQADFFVINGTGENAGKRIINTGDPSDEESRAKVLGMQELTIPHLVRRLLRRFWIQPAVTVSTNPKLEFGKVYATYHFAMQLPCQARYPGTFTASDFLETDIRDSAKPATGKQKKDIKYSMVQDQWFRTRCCEILFEQEGGHSGYTNDADALVSRNLVSKALFEMIATIFKPNLVKAIDLEYPALNAVLVYTQCKKIVDNLAVDLQANGHSTDASLLIEKLWACVSMKVLQYPVKASQFRDKVGGERQHDLMTILGLCIYEIKNTDILAELQNHGNTWAVPNVDDFRVEAERMMIREQMITDRHSPSPIRRSGIRHRMSSANSSTRSRTTAVIDKRDEVGTGGGGDGGGGNGYSHGRTRPGRQNGAHSSRRRVSAKLGADDNRRTNTEMKSSEASGHSPRKAKGMEPPLGSQHAESRTPGAKASERPVTPPSMACAVVSTQGPAAPQGPLPASPGPYDAASIPTTSEASPPTPPSESVQRKLFLGPEHASENGEGVPPQVENGEGGPGADSAMNLELGPPPVLSRASSSSTQEDTDAEDADPVSHGQGAASPINS